MVPIFRINTITYMRLFSLDFTYVIICALGLLAHYSSAVLFRTFDQTTAPLKIEALRVLVRCCIFFISEIIMFLGAQCFRCYR